MLKNIRSLVIHSSGLRSTPLYEKFVQSESDSFRLHRHADQHMGNYSASWSVLIILTYGNIDRSGKSPQYHPFSLLLLLSLDELILII